MTKIRRISFFASPSNLVALLWLGCFSLSANAGKVPDGFTEHDAEVNGTHIHYYFGGKGSPVILLHGYAQTSHMWTPIMPLLAKNHTVIVPDLRGGSGRATLVECVLPTGRLAGRFGVFPQLRTRGEDFAALGATPLPMPVFVLTGEKASGTFLIEQTKLVATNVEGKVVAGTGH